METNKERFLKLVSPEKTDTVKFLQYQIKNRYWIRVSQRIALKVLIKLDELNWTKDDLAKAMKVSKITVDGIVTGKKNLTLKVIVKLKQVLGIEL